MSESSCRTRRRVARKRVVGAALALALVVSACGADDPIAAPVTGATTTSTAPPAAEATTTAPVAGPEPADAPPTTVAESTDGSPGPETSNGAGEADGDFPGEPSWSEVLDRLEASEQSCIREVLDGAGLDEAGRDSAMGRRLFSDDFPVAEDATMFACLAAGTAVDIFAGSMIAAMESELGTEVSGDERACLRDWWADIDLTALVVSTGESPDDAASALVILGGMADCVPDGLVSLLLADAGVSLEELSEDEKTCVRDLMAEVDWSGLADSEDAEAAFTEVFALSFGLLGCLPDLAEGEMAPLPGEFSTEGAMPVAVGAAVEGTLDSADNVDLFVFDAVAGEFYEMRVASGTLEDPTLALYDADGWYLDYDDDSGDALAPLLYWEAPSAGSVYVEVGGFGAGSYTLTIAVSDVVDDHADSEAGATAARVGEPVEGVLHYGGDVDFFVFDAVEGESYEMRVASGTLEDPTLALYDADGWYLDYDDDSGGALAPLLHWEAPSAGSVYVEVGGFGAGSYTLTITRG